jgi:hypothetical protein
VEYTKQEQEWAKSTQAVLDRGTSEQTLEGPSKNQAVEQNSRTSRDLIFDRKSN